VVVAGAQRTVRQDCEVLVRKIEAHLVSLRSAGTPVPASGDLAAAERVADALRRLVAETARASAADRARVRAAVHYFVSRGGGRSHGWRYDALPPRRGRRNERRPVRSLGDDVRVVNDILRGLGRGDLGA
jgi:hypothetical protein